MTVRISDGLRSFIVQNGSLKAGLHNGVLRYYSGAQPASANNAPTGTLLAEITSSSLVHTAEVVATGSITIAGVAGSINTLTIDSVDIIDAAVPFNTTLAQTAIDLALAINNNQSQPEYTATASGAVVTVKAGRGAGVEANGLVIANTLTTLTTTLVNMAGGVNAVNGLRFGVALLGALNKLSTQTWSGVAGATGTAGWFRLTGAVVDDLTLDTDESELRLDGAISTSGSDLNLTSTAISSGATQTISAFTITLPAA